MSIRPGRRALALLLPLMAVLATPASQATAYQAAPPSAPTQKPLPGDKPRGDGSELNPFNAPDGPADPGWPRSYDTDAGTVLCYQPQIDGWDRGRVNGRMAVAVRQGTDEPLYGAVWFAGKTVADLDERVVQIYDINVSKVSFPTGGKQAAKLEQAVGQLIPGNVRHLDLDRLMANLARTRREAQVSSAKLLNTPPTVVVVHRPAVLVPTSGEPVLKAIPGTPLASVVNTPADVLRDDTTGDFYFATADAWVQAPNLMTGPWSWAKAAPPGIDKIPADNPVAGALQVGLHKGDDPAPQMVVAGQPTELISIGGDAQLKSIEKTNLSYVANTPNDVFKTSDGTWYALLSGRWYSAPDLDAGPWAPVPQASLPKDFASIPVKSPKGTVLASVAGTPQAQEAILATRVPQLAAVKRGSASLQPTFDGKPNFMPIEGTDLSYATNSPFDVIRYHEAFYCCYQGVWFTAPKVTGPWGLADLVPEEMYDIPPSNPLYHNTFVEIYDSSPDEVVFGYLPGYLNTYVDNGVVVYGTGFDYAPYHNADRQTFYSWPVTWGGGWKYNPYIGGFGYRPGWYTPYQHGYVRAGWNPTTGWAGAGVQRYSPYSHWGSAVARHGGSWVRAASYAETRPKDGGPVNRTTVAKTSNDVYVGHDGDIYRRTETGAWQRMSGAADAKSGWSDVNARRPQPGGAAYPAREVISALDGEYGARTDGQAAVDSWNAWRPNYRPGNQQYIPDTSVLGPTTVYDPGGTALPGGGNLGAPVPVEIVQPSGPPIGVDGRPVIPPQLGIGGGPHGLPGPGGLGGDFRPGGALGMFGRLGGLGITAEPIPAYQPPSMPAGGSLFNRGGGYSGGISGGRGFRP